MPSNKPPQPSTSTLQQLQYSSEFRIWSILTFIILLFTGITFTFSIWFRNLPFFGTPTQPQYRLPCTACKVLGPELTVFLLFAGIYPLYKLYTIYCNNLQLIHLHSTSQQKALYETNQDLTCQNEQLAINCSTIQHELDLLNDDAYYFSHKTLSLEIVVPNDTSSLPHPQNDLLDSIYNKNDPNTSFSVHLHSNHHPVQNQQHAQQSTTQQLTKTIAEFVEEFQKLYSLHQSAGTEYQELLMMYDQIQKEFQNEEENKNKIILDTELQYQDLISKYQSLSDDYSNLQQHNREIGENQRNLNDNEKILNQSHYDSIFTEKSTLETQNLALNSQVEELQNELNNIHRSIYQYLQIYNTNLQAAFITRAQYSLNPQFTTLAGIDASQHSQQHLQNLQYSSSNRKSLNFDPIENSSITTPEELTSGLVYNGLNAQNPPNNTKTGQNRRQSSSLQKLGSILASTNPSQTINIQPTPLFQPSTPSLNTHLNQTTSNHDNTIHSNNSTNRRTSFLNSHFTPQIPKSNVTPLGIINNNNSPNLPSLSNHQTISSSSSTLTQNTQNNNKINHSSNNNNINNINNNNNNNILDISQSSIHFNPDHLTPHRSSFSTSIQPNQTSHPHSYTHLHPHHHPQEQSQQSQQSQQSRQSQQHTGQIVFTHWKPDPPAALGYVLEPVQIDDTFSHLPFPISGSGDTNKNNTQTPIQISTQPTFLLIQKLIHSYQDQQRKTEAYIRVIIKDVNNKFSTNHMNEAMIQNELESLHKQLSTLKNTLSTTQDQLDNKNNEVISLKEKVITLTSPPDGSQSTLQQQRSTHDYEMELLSLSTQLHDIQNQRDILENEVETQNEKIEQLSTNLQSLESAKNALETQSIDEMNIFQDEKEKVMTNYQRLENDYNEVCEKHDHLSNEYIKLTEDYHTLQDLYEQTHIELNDIGTTYHDLEIKYTQSKEQYNLLQDQFARLESINESSDTQQMNIISQLQEQNILLKQTNHDKEREYNSIQRLCKEYQSQIHAQQLELTTLRNKLSNTQFTIQSLHNELEHTQQHLLETQDQFNTTTTTTQLLNTQTNKQLSYENDILSRRIEEKEGYINNLLKKVDILETDIQNIQFESTQLKEQLNESVLNTTTLSTTSMSHQSENDSLYKENKNLLYKYKKLQKDLQLSYETQDNLRKEINVLNTSYQNDLDHSKNLLERSQLHILSHHNQHQQQQKLNLTQHHTHNTTTHPHINQNNLTRDKVTSIQTPGDVHYDTDRSFLNFSLSQLPGFQQSTTSSTVPQQLNRNEPGFQTPASKYPNRQSQSNGQNHHQLQQQQQQHHHQLQNLDNSTSTQSSHQLSQSNNKPNTTTISINPHSTHHKNNIPDSPISTLLNSVMSPFQPRPTNTNTHLPPQHNTSQFDNMQPPHIQPHIQPHTQPQTQFHNNISSTNATTIPQPPQRNKQRHSMGVISQSNNNQQQHQQQHHQQQQQQQQQQQDVPQTPSQSHHTQSDATLTPFNNYSNNLTFMSPFQSPHDFKQNNNIKIKPGLDKDAKRRQTYSTAASTASSSSNIGMKLNASSQPSTLMSPTPTPNQSNNKPNSLSSPTTSASLSNRSSISSTYSTNSTGSNSSNGFHRVRLLNEDTAGQHHDIHGIRISHPDRDMLLMQSPIKHGDVLLSIADIAIQSADDYAHVVNNNITIGQPFFVVIRRDNAQVYTYSFILEGKNDPAPDGTVTFKKKFAEVSNRVATNSFFDCRPYHNLTGF